MRVISTGGYFFEVMKLESGKRYAVDLNKMTCTCPDHKERQVKCKHIWRVELEGYEGPQSDPDSPSTSEDAGSRTDWRPEGEGFVWFNNLSKDQLRSNASCLVAPGKRKPYKYWIVCPCHNQGKIYLYWGELSPVDLAQGPLKGQQKEVDCLYAPPVSEARDRFFEKLKKEYYVPDSDLKQAIMDAFIARYASRDSAPADAEEPIEKKDKTNWKPDNSEFVWF